MKNKKIGIFLLLVLLVGVGAFYYFNRQDENSTLTILDKQWIESNKNKVIDLSIVNDVSILNYSGKGLIFDFLKDLEKDTKLSFNKISYDYGDEVKADYAFKTVEKKGKNDILIERDHFVLVTKSKVLYTKASEIKNLKIGVLENQMDAVSRYLSGATNVSFASYSDKEKIMKAMEDGDVDAGVVPRLATLKEIISKNYYLSYPVTEMTEDYVLSLGNNNRLNQILTKYYNKWKDNHFEQTFNKYFTNHYFTFSGVEEKDKVNFKSKRYTYGFVDNVPYDTTLVGKLLGINSNFIKQFASTTGIEINYKRYDNIKDLISAFSSNKIDFFFNQAQSFEADLDLYDTISPFDETIVIVSSLGNDLLVNSVYSLEGKTVSTIKSSKIDEYFQKLNIKTKTYHNIDDLISSRDKNMILAIDKNEYEYYSKSSLSRYKVDFEFKLDGEYYYTSRSIKNNKLFNQFFDFYLSFVNQRQIVNHSFHELFNIGNKPTIIKLAIITLASFVAIVLVIISLKMIKPKKKGKQPKISKEDKLRYIDLLTSLKNRNYLNDNIERWDESEIYPQTIVIVDLNNIAYINDNYGHAEGDEVICQAANILIQSQLENTDIIRTNGNEFLIYLVEYEEKEVISYIRKLNKEFKSLKHGYGAAIGYSVINDGIKTIDDAVNEATLDMRNNKEETNN